MDEKLHLSQKIKHWLAATPSPRSGRASLLHAAALLSQPKPIELSWFDVPGRHHPTDHYLSVYTWAMVNSFQTRLAGLYLNV